MVLFKRIRMSEQSKHRGNKPEKLNLPEFPKNNQKKRIGWVLDELKVPKKIISRLKKKIPRTNFLVSLNPKNNVGPVNKKWGVIKNVKLLS